MAKNNYFSSIAKRFYRHLLLVRKYKKIPARELSALEGRITVAQQALKAGTKVIGEVSIDGKAYPAYLLSYSGENVNIGDKVKVLFIQGKRFLYIAPVASPIAGKTVLCIG